MNTTEAFVDNDFRQFGLIRNLELENRRFKLQLLEFNGSIDFAAGETATQGFTGSSTQSITGFNIIRAIVSFSNSTVTGCSELVVDTVKSLTSTLSESVTPFSIKRYSRG